MPGHKLNWSELVLMRTRAKRHKVLQDNMKKSFFFIYGPKPLPLSFAFCVWRPVGWLRIFGALRFPPLCRDSCCEQGATTAA